MEKKVVNVYKQMMSNWRQEHSADYNVFLQLVKNAERGDEELIKRMNNALVKKWWYLFAKNICFVGWLPERIKRNVMNVMLNDAGGRFCEENGILAKSCLYWLYFDNGAQTFVKIANGIKARCENPSQEKMVSFVAHIIMAISISNHMNSKTSWRTALINETIEDSDLKGRIKQVKSNNRGRNYVFIPLEEMIIEGKQEQTIKAISNLIQERTSDSQLAYILYGLNEAKLLKDCCLEYSVFHRSLQRKFPAARIGDVGRARNLYNRINSGDQTKLGKKEINEFAKWKPKVSQTLTEVTQ